jgi:signal transduction histidine kinase
MQLLNESTPRTSNVHLLLAYVADLELEVDRLRRQGQFVQHEVRTTLKRIQSLCAETDKPVLSQIDDAARQMAVVLRDLQESPGYHPAHDQVIAVAVRPLIEQVFRWQQRLESGQSVVLHLELETEYINWFPARFRHILDNLMSNALKYRDADKHDQWVRVGLRSSPQAYELRLADNGRGVPAAAPTQVFELLFRAAPARGAGLGVGLAVVKLLIEQSGGSLTVDSKQGSGSTFVAVLPRYEIDDYLTE